MPQGQVRVPIGTVWVVSKAISQRCSQGSGGKVQTNLSPAEAHSPTACTSNPASSIQLPVYLISASLASIATRDNLHGLHLSSHLFHLHNCFFPHFTLGLQEFQGRWSQRLELTPLFSLCSYERQWHKVILSVTCLPPFLPPFLSPSPLLFGKSVLPWPELWNYLGREHRHWHTLVLVNKGKFITKCWLEKITMTVFTPYTVRARLTNYVRYYFMYLDPMGHR